MRIKKYMVFTVLCVLFLLLIFLLLPEKKYPLYEELLIRNSVIQCTCCNQPENNKVFSKNILFLKTHKCGSSTVQNIIFRFGLRYNLSFILPNGIFEVTYYQKFSPIWLPPRDKTPDGKYNILANHIRYGPEIRNSMYSDTKAVTIMRDPVTLFESLYTYFKLYLSNGGLSFKQWLKLPVKPPMIINAYPTQYLGYNQMSMDLGIDMRHFRNETAIQNFIEYIDQEFDLVMITEHMDASLVLLANLMGWPLEYVKYLKQNHRTKFQKHSITDQERTMLMNLNYADTLLYNYFLKKFQACVVQYGVERMNKDITRLRKLNQQFQQECDAKEVTHPLGFVIYNKANNSDFDCKYSIMDQISLAEHIKNVQEERYKKQRLAERLALE